MTFLTPKKITAAIVGLLLSIIILVGLNNIIVDVPATKYCVKQAFMTGDLEVFDSPGWKTQMFGNLTWYDRSRQLWFSHDQSQGGEVDLSLPIRFSDGGTARISGSLRYDLPSGDKLLELHKRYKNMNAIETELLIPAIQKAVQLSGPIMTSKESAAARRADLLSIIEDQIINGVYKSKKDRIEITDLSTGTNKFVDVMVPITDPSAPNGIARVEISPIKAAGILIHAIAINDIRYDKSVEDAIQAQYALEMQVQTAIAKTNTANQEALTAKAVGEANATKAEWEEKEKAIRIQVQAENAATVAKIEADKRLEVAKLDKLTAEKEKEAMVLRASGEAESQERLAEARKKQMLADGALDKKLDAYIKVNQAYADALQHIQLPTVMLNSGGTNSNGSSPANELIEMIRVKTAMDLGKDIISIQQK